MDMRKGLRDQMELWLMLLFLTSMGWSFGLILTSVLVGAFGTPPERGINLILAGILGGILVSFISAFVLRNEIITMRDWIIAASLGWLLGLLATVYSIQFIQGVGGWIIGGALGGLIYALVQSFGLRKAFGRNITWIILNALGWVSAYGLGYTLPAGLGMDRIATMSLAISQGMVGWVMVGTFAVLLIILLFATLGKGDRGERIQWWP